MFRMATFPAFRFVTKQTLKTIITITFKWVISTCTIFAVRVWNTCITFNSLVTRMAGTNSRGTTKPVFTGTTFGYNKNENA